MTHPPKAIRAAFCRHFSFLNDTPMPSAPSADRYDTPTRLLHWLSALLILTLFLLPQIWSRLPREARAGYEHLHVSLGVILAAVFLARVLWRALRSVHLPAEPGLQGALATSAHRLLYLLMLIQILTGLARRWVRERGVEFFGLMIPPPLHLNPDWRPVISAVHNWNQWLIVTVALLHASAALMHHYIRRDGVLRRML